MRLPKRALSTRRLNFMLVVWTGVILGVLGGSSVTAASEEVPGGEVLSAVPGLSLYTHEKHGEILIRVAETVPISGCSVVLRGPGVGRVRVALQQRETVVPFDLARLARIVKTSLLAAATTGCRSTYSTFCRTYLDRSKAVWSRHMAKIILSSRPALVAGP